MRGRILKASVVTGLCLLWGSPSFAQPAPAGFAACRTVADSLERLRCYDGLAVPAPPPAPAARNGGYQQVSIVDFKVDRQTLRGRLVELQGNLTVMGEMAMLQGDPMDMNPVYLNITGLPRDQMRQVLERCGMGGCAVTVRGRVGSTNMMQVGLVVDQVAFR